MPQYPSLDFPELQLGSGLLTVSSPYQPALELFTLDGLDSTDGDYVCGGCSHCRSRPARRRAHPSYAVSHRRACSSPIPRSSRPSGRAAVRPKRSLRGTGRATGESVADETSSGVGLGGARRASSSVMPGSSSSRCHSPPESLRLNRQQIGRAIPRPPLSHTHPSPSYRRHHRHHKRSQDCARDLCVPV